MMTMVLALMGPEVILPYLYAAFVLMLGVYGFLWWRKRNSKGVSATSSPQSAAVPRDRPLNLAAAFDRAPAGIGFLGPEQQWVDVNKRLLTVLGYTKNELGSLPMRQLTHPEDRKREANLFADLRTGKRSAYIMSKRVQRKGGEFRNFRVHMLRCSETPQPVFQCVLEDEGPHGSQLETLCAAMSDDPQAAVLFCDAGGSITRWNSGAERLFGYSEVEAVGMSWARLHSGETKESLVRMLSTAARDGYARTANMRRRNDGSPLTVRSVIVADMVRGEATGFLEVCHPDGE
jgi:PAS domain S-box-containing protein